MKKILLTDCCELVMGQSPVSSSYNTEKRGLPFYQGNADFGKINPITRCWCDKPIKIAYKDDILISVRAPIGAINIASEECCIGRGLAAVRALKGKCLYEFLYYALQSNTEELKSQGTGSTFKAISKQILANSELPDITLEEQHRIVNRLLKVDTLIENANEQLRLFDQLVKSRFIELFGDPVSNPKNWAKKAIKEFATDVRYGTSKPAIEGGRYPYLRMNNLTYDGRLDLSDLKYIDIPDNELEKCVVKYGDILFNRTNSIELVGKTCLFEFNYPMVIAGYIIRIRLNDRVTPLYLTTYMNLEFMKKQLRNMAKGAVNQANINAQEMQSIIVPVPPLDLQNQFADFVEEVNKSKFTHCYELLLLIIKKIWYNNYV